MATKRSNLQCFLDSVTPTVDTRYIYKPPPTKNGPPWYWCWGKQDFVEYYTLSELWDSLSEWSSFGASTDVMLPSGETIVQYFAPYLSAIQLYSNDSSLIAARNFALQNGMMYWYENEYYMPEPSQSWNTLPMDLLFSKMNLEDAEKNAGFKYFEYFEASSPYTRMPLVDKVQELAQNVPGLRSLKSLDLSPSSWMSISWFPIYTIPAQLEREKHKACFLTYHRLSTCPNDTFESSEATKELSDRKGKGLLIEQSKDKELLQELNKRKQKNAVMNKSLPPFGLVTYKVNGAIWNNPETGDHALAESLLYAAGTWLREIQVQHPDFNFFLTHNSRGY